MQSNFLAQQNAGAIAQRVKDITFGRMMVTLTQTHILETAKVNQKAARTVFQKYNNAKEQRQKVKEARPKPDILVQMRRVVQERKKAIFELKLWKYA